MFLEGKQGIRSSKADEQSIVGFSGPRSPPSEEASMFLAQIELSIVTIDQRLSCNPAARSLYARRYVVLPRARAHVYPSPTFLSVIQVAIRRSQQDFHLHPLWLSPFRGETISPFHCVGWKLYRPP